MQVKRLVLPNLAAITNQYDTVVRLLGTYLRTSSGVLTNKHEYAYNRASQRTNEVRIDASTLDYRYDPIGQLKLADSSVAFEDRGYTYDAAWNLNYRTNNGVLGTLAVNSLNEITSASGTFAAAFSDPPSAQYDTNGNLTQFGDFYMVSRYFYDENRLVTWQRYNLDAEELEDQTLFVHDGLGRLRQRTEYDPDNSVWPTNNYVYDGKRVIQERSGNTGLPTVSYTRGLDLSGSLEGAGGIGGLLARSHGYSSGNWSTHSYYHADGNGNVTFMLNSSQIMVARYRYDPFGNTISQSGSLASANVYRFSSKEYHGPSGMYYYLYRWYSPELQRWVNRDPIEEEGGFNLHRFVGNDPVNSIDPRGLLEWSEIVECSEREIQDCFSQCWPDDFTIICYDLYADVPGDPDNPDFLAHGSVCTCKKPPRPPFPFPMPEPVKEPRPVFMKPLTPIFRCH